ncbi:MAG TPA: GNAT family N-acetyltransferase [Conexibacter sp.]|jgi:GNAT superfamily N-acetyltransferase
METIEIRPLRASDRAAWDELWDGYLRFYRHTLAAEVTDTTFRRLSEREDGMFALVAVGADDVPVGFSHALVHRSTWALTTYCYLEDLFVAPAARGRAAGHALIEATAAEAKAQGSEQLYWRTEQFNAPARKLYETVARLGPYVVYERELG